MTFRFPLIALALLTSTLYITSCEEGANTSPSETPDTDSTALSATGDLRVAFIYGDSVNERYTFLIDAEEELEIESKRIDERLRKKLQRAEGRARELQEQAPTMTQSQMQEAQLELQSLDLEMQQFQEKLSGDFRKREIELQNTYVERINTFLEEYNKDDKYDIIMNFQQGGNLLWINDAFDITDEVVVGLNEAYDRELEKAASEQEK